MVLAHDASALPAHTLRKVDDLCRRLSIPTTIARHAPTLTAAETQAVLPESCLVQKTITGCVANKIILWTGVGDFRVSRTMHKRANERLALPAGRDHTMNPPQVDPLHFYGMNPGMVSPFLIENTPAVNQLAALFVLDWPHYAEPFSVAISLSLTESLVIPLARLNALLCAYANAVYGHVPIFRLSQSR